MSEGGGEREKKKTQEKFLERPDKESENVK